MASHKNKTSNKNTRAKKDVIIVQVPKKKPATRKAKPLKHKDKKAGLFARVKEAASVDHDLVQQEVHHVAIYIKEIFAAVILVVFMVFSLVGLFISHNGEYESARAEEAGDAVLIWTQSEQISKVADSSEVSIIAGSTESFFTAKFDEGLVRFTGRIPEYQNINIDRIGSTLLVSAEVFDSSVVKDCEFLFNPQINSELVDVKSQQIVDSIYSSSLTDLEITEMQLVLVPVIQPSLVNEMKACIQSDLETLQQASTLQAMIITNKNTIVYAPTGIGIEGIDPELADYITYAKICPCGEFPDIIDQDMKWIQYAIRDLPGDHPVSIEAEFELRASPYDELASPEDVTTENIDSIRDTLKGRSNLYLKNLIAVNSVSKQSIIDTYNQEQERIRLQQEQQERERARQASSRRNSFVQGPSFGSGITSTPVNPGQPAPVNPGCGFSDSSLSQLYCLINEYRIASGRSAMDSDGTMAVAANNHNQWMVSTGNFTHAGPGGNRFWDRCSAVGASCSSEILARSSYTSASQCMVAWKSSSSHNAALLNPAFGTMGGAISGGYCTLLLR